jgi:hypothetical protein
MGPFLRLAGIIKDVKEMIMTNKPLEKMRKDELILVANEFGVELSENDTKNQILEKLREDGITDELAQDFFNRSVSEEEVRSDSGSTEAEQEEEGKEETKPEPETSVKEDKVIVLMTRKNPMYSGKGYVFTRNHPFQALPKSLAEHLISNEKGFRQATESEVKSFYG